MIDAFKVVRDFEKAVADYTGAPEVVAVNSCTNGLFLVLKYLWGRVLCNDIQIPEQTYLSVPMQIHHAGFNVSFRDVNWSGMYQLDPLPLWDSARRFTRNMFMDTPYVGNPYKYIVTSHHHSKILGATQGGCILHNDPDFDKWARRARFDGRAEGVAPKDDKDLVLGYHMYMSPDTAAQLLWKLSKLPANNPDLPWDDYPDLSTFEVFK